MKTLELRRDFGLMLADMRIEVGVEVGVDCGDFAMALLDDWYTCRTLYLVDPYEPYDELPWPRIGDRHIAMTQLAKHGGRCRFVQLSSLHACSAITRNDIGFVYIDGDHRYESARDDIAAWYQKLMPGGVLAGHDYADGFSGVRRAVDEFVASTGLPLNVTGEVRESPSWYVFKP